MDENKNEMCKGNDNKNMHILFHRLRVQEEVKYEIVMNKEHWMAAGRKKGFVVLPTELGAPTMVGCSFVPISSGYVHPPALRLTQVDTGLVNHIPAGPHLVCVLPPQPSSAYCVSKRV